MIKYNIYIGSNNTTKIVEECKAKDIINKYFDGYTIIKTQGFWQGIPENSIIIELLEEENTADTIYKMITELREELQQNSILLTYTFINSKFL